MKRFTAAFTISSITLLLASCGGGSTGSSNIDPNPPIPSGGGHLQADGSAESVLQSGNTCFLQPGILYSGYQPGDNATFTIYKNTTAIYSGTDAPLIPVTNSFGITSYYFTNSTTIQVNCSDASSNYSATFTLHNADDSQSGSQQTVQYGPIVGSKAALSQQTPAHYNLITKQLNGQITPSKKQQLTYQLADNQKPVKLNANNSYQIKTAEQPTELTLAASKKHKNVAKIDIPVQRDYGLAAIISKPAQFDLLNDTIDAAIINNHVISGLKPTDTQLENTIAAVASESELNALMQTKAFNTLKGIYLTNPTNAIYLTENLANNKTLWVKLNALELNQLAANKQLTTLVNLLQQHQGLVIFDPQNKPLSSKTLSQLQSVNFKLLTDLNKNSCNSLTSPAAKLPGFSGLLLNLLNRDTNEGAELQQLKTCILNYNQATGASS